MKKNTEQRIGFDSMIYKVFLHVLMFFYLYSIQFNFIPFGLGTRVILGLFGFIYLLSSIFLVSKAVTFKKHYLVVLTFLFLLSSISVVSLIVNRATDIEFIKYPISIILILLAGDVLLKLVALKYKERPFSGVAVLFVNIVLFQVLLSLMMFLIPALREFLNSTIVLSELESSLLNETEGFRLVGFGSKFFGSAVINGFALMLIATIIKYEKIGFGAIMYYSMVFITIFILGMMMARSTVIGGALAMGILFFPSTGINTSRVKRQFGFIAILVIFPLLLVLLLFYSFPEFAYSMEAAFNFGFELFVNYFQAGDLSSESTSQLKDMYVLPKNWKTIIVGDGYFSDPFNSGFYYMGTDVGYLRLIYYFGLIGLFVYLAMQFYLIRAAYRKNRKYGLLFCFSILYLLILSAKGFTDLLFIMILFIYGNCRSRSTTE